MLYNPGRDFRWLFLRPWVWIPRLLQVLWTLGGLVLVLLLRGGSKSAEVQHILEDAEVALVLADEAGQQTLDALPRRTRGSVSCHPLDVQPITRSASHATAPPLLASRSDDDLAMLIYTSGTTGKSKGVMLTYAAVLGNMRALTSAWRFSEADELALALPLFHVHGLCIGVHGALIHGAVIRLFPRFDADAVLDALSSTSTIFMGVPTMYTRVVDRLSEQPARGDALARGRSGGSDSRSTGRSRRSRAEAATARRRRGRC